MKLMFADNSRRNPLARATQLAGDVFGHRRPHNVLPEESERLVTAADLRAFGL